MTAGPATLALSPYVVDPSSKTDTAVRKACGSFDENFTLAAVKKDTGALPDFITLSGSTLTITPLDHTDMGTWIITVTQTTVKGANPVWDAATITVGCRITAIAAAAAPASPAVTLTYNLYSPPLLINLATWVYTQTPSCGYTYTEAFTWTIPGAVTSYV